MNIKTLIYQTPRYKYYVDQNGKLYRHSKNKTTELGYIDDNMRLYKKMCESA